MHAIQESQQAPVQPDGSASVVQKPSMAEENFSLVLGGPLYQLFVRAGMARPTMELVQRRIIAWIALTWVPLAALTVIGGTFSGGVPVPFMTDLDTHVRFLLSIPLLIGAEVIVHRRLRNVVAQFVERGIVPDDQRARFDRLIEQAMSIRNSKLIEIALLIAAFVGGHWLWRNYVELRVPTWYGRPDAEEVQLTFAGFWYMMVALPLSRFILLRWYFRILIWLTFMFRVARLRLRLNALHPDRAGGLGFVAGSADAFMPILMAHTIFLSGVIGNQIWHAGATLPSFKMVIIISIAMLVLLALLPLMPFCFQLAEARRAALRENGLLAQRYVSEYTAKWLRGGRSSDEPMLGSGDFQSLADLGNSFVVVRETGLLPFGKGMIVRMSMLLALPFAPLLLTMFPLEEAVERLLKLAL